MKTLLFCISFSLPIFLFAQNNPKLERLNEALLDAEISEGKCGRIIQKFYHKNGSLIYSATSKKCQKSDSLWVDPSKVKITSKYNETSPSTIYITCIDQLSCINKIQFLGNRSLARTNMEATLEIKTTLPKREFNNLVSTLSQLDSQ